MVAPCPFTFAQNFRTLNTESTKRYTITAALPYANGPVHIGHLAGCYIPADIYARYLRMRGNDVLFVCGSDEHGIPITIKAKNEGVTPQEVVDKYNKIMGDAFRDFGIGFDIYSRTSAPIHKETASAFFLDLYKSGKLLEKETEEYFDPEAGEFLADRYIVGTCPNCANPNAYGDQCEKCGRSLSPEELINPRSKLSGATPIKKKTIHWYLDLEKAQTWLKPWIKSKKNWKANVLGQCLSWMGDGDNGLKPRAVTRDLKWGVPVPEEIPGHEGKMLYVWFDAPIGYISATKDFFVKRGDNKPAWVKGNTWEDYWENGKTNLVHFIGKDNIVFHCIIFPAMIESLNETKDNFKITLPENVPANEFLNLEGDKISTSRNWAVWLHEYLQEMPGREDELRYVLTANMPETKDNDFVWKYDGTDNTTDSFQAKVNNELVNNLGNFVNRVFVLTHKFFEGKVPEAAGTIGTQEENLYQKMAATFDAIDDNLGRFEFRNALSDIMKLSTVGNQYLQHYEPWKLFKTDPEKTADVLHHGLQLTATLASLMEPFLPKTAAKIKAVLNVTGTQDWDSLKKGSVLQAGTAIGEPVHLFARVTDEEIKIQLDKLQASKAANTEAQAAEPAVEKTVAPGKAEIQYDDFAKIDIRVGKITHAQKVPKADKLLQLTVDTGIDVRTILSGIAEHFTPEEIIGKQVSVLVNLAPRKMRGVDSQGMILMAEDENGKLVFVNPDREVNAGAEIK